MHHGGGDEAQLAGTQAQGVALAHHHAAVFEGGVEEGGHDAEGAGAGHHLGRRVALHEARDVGAVVGLHVLYHQVVRGASAQLGLDLAQPLVAKALLDAVHDSDLLVDDEVGIVCHAVGHLVHSLEEVDVVVVDAHVEDVARNLHVEAAFLVNRRRAGRREQSLQGA